MRYICQICRYVYDDEKEKAINLLKNIILSVQSLPKWNGHLYNWYNIKTMQQLIPRYVSTVDSGNLVGYMYTTKAFLDSPSHAIAPFSYSPKSTS